LPAPKNKILNRTVLQNQTVFVGRVNQPLFFSRQNWLLRQKKNFEEKMRMFHSINSKICFTILTVVACSKKIKF
jgi:hypothetical protein